jgi:hypothetical protein
MSTLNIVWLFATVTLPIIVYLRYRDHPQPIWSVLVALTMSSAVVAIFLGQEEVAYVLKMASVLVSVLAIALNERWKRNQ